MSLGDGLDDLIRRLEACEARQRNYGMHDPNCPLRLYQKAQERTSLGVIFDPKKHVCNCWLLEEPSKPKPEIFRKFTIGDDTTHTFNIIHGLASKELYQGKHQLSVSVRVKETGLELMGEPYGPRLGFPDLNTLQLIFPNTLAPPSANSLEVTVYSKEKTK